MTKVTITIEPKDQDEMNLATETIGRLGIDISLWSEFCSGMSYIIPKADDGTKLFKVELDYEEDNSG